MIGKEGTARSYTGRLRWVLLLSAGFLLVELVGGILANSLALLSDAGHMLSDVTALSLALLSLHAMHRPPDAKRTYGYRRVEILAALGNGLLLCGMAVFVVVHAYRRLESPPEIRGGLMLLVAAMGLCVNLVGLFLLRHERKGSLGVRGAFLHILGDTLGSLGAITAAILITTIGWTKADAVVSFIIGALILLSGGHLIRECLHIFMEGVPRHIHLPEVAHSLREQDGVLGIHDLHIWRIGSDFDTLTVHLVMQNVEEWRNRRDAVREMLCKRFGIHHCTIQVEEEGEQQDSCCDRPICEGPDG